MIILGRSLGYWDWVRFGSSVINRSWSWLCASWCKWYWKWRRKQRWTHLLVSQSGRFSFRWFPLVLKTEARFWLVKSRYQSSRRNLFENLSQFNMLTSNEYFKCHQWCCHEVTDWQDFTAHVFNFFDLYATDVKIYPGIVRFESIDEIDLNHLMK